MLRSSYFPLDPLVQGFAISQFGVGRVNSLLDDILEALVLAQLHAEADHFPQAIPVEGVLEIVIVQDGRGIGVGGSELQLAGAGR